MSTTSTRYHLRGSTALSTADLAAGGGEGHRHQFEKIKNQQHDDFAAAASSDLAALLTVVIVTSPINSHPDTEMVDQVIYSAVKACGGHEFLSNGGQVVVACDGYEVVREEGGVAGSSDGAEQGQGARTTTNKGTTTSKGQHDESKRCYGRVSRNQAAKYEGYIANLKARAEERSWLRVIEPVAGLHKGFAHTLKAALVAPDSDLEMALGAASVVQTPLVMVLPHDVRLDVEVLGGKKPEGKSSSSSAAAVGTSMVVRDCCAVIQRSEAEGRHVALREMNFKNLREPSGQGRGPEPLVQYIGFMSGRTANIQQRYQEKAGLRLERVTVYGAGGGGSTTEDRSSNQEISLLPLPLWKENPHIASVRAYKDFVFNSKLRQIRRGQFIEETVGQEMLKALKKGEAVLERDFGTWLLAPGCSDVAQATVHLDGRCYLPVAEREQRKWRVDRDKKFVEETQRFFAT